MDTNGPFDALVLHLANLESVAELGWCDGVRQVLPNVHLGTYVDVTVNSICDVVEIPWLWTVVHPDDTEALTGDEHSLVIPLANDLVVWAVYDPAEHWYRTSSAVALTLDEEPAADQLAALYDDADECQGTIETIPAWRSSSIDQALEKWCARHVNRTDLRFHELPEDLPHYLTMLIERAGTGERYEIADHVSVSDHVFDQLLAMDPDQAAEITATVERIARTHIPFAENPHLGDESDT